MVVGGACWLALLAGVAGWRCWLALRVGTAGWRCWLALRVGTAGWHCGLALRVGTAAGTAGWHCGWRCGWRCGWHCGLRSFDRSLLAGGAWSGDSIRVAATALCWRGCQSRLAATELLAQVRAVRRPIRQSDRKLGASSCGRPSKGPVGTGPFTFFSCPCCCPERSDERAPPGTQGATASASAIVGLALGKPGQDADVMGNWRIRCPSTC